MSKNLPASVRQRLLNLARERGEPFDLVLTHYGIERLLVRLTKSRHAKRFILKGAMLFHVWGRTPTRPTRDVDLLGFGDASIAAVEKMFRDICEVDVDDDGLRFDAGSVEAREIRDTQEYGGIRVKLEAELAGAKIRLQADVGFGDAVTPEASEVAYPALLGGDGPRLRAYPLETVIAEKFEAMVSLGMLNSRMKDYFDVWLIAGTFEISGGTLREAVGRTFERRGTEVPAQTPSGLSAGFSTDEQRRRQWEAFRSRLNLEAPALDEAVAACGRLLAPVAEAVHSGQPLDATWPPGGPWTPTA